MVLLGLTAALLLLWRPGRGPRRTQVGVTGEISGRWITEAPRYADRFLEIRADRVVFGQGDAGEASRPLVDVYVEKVEGGGQEYVVVHEGDDLDSGLSELRLRIVRGRLILSSLPDVVWVRSP